MSHCNTSLPHCGEICYLTAKRAGEGRVRPSSEAFPSHEVTCTDPDDALSFTVADVGTDKPSRGMMLLTVPH